VRSETWFKVSSLVLTDWKVRYKTAPTCFRLSTSRER